MLSKKYFFLELRELEKSIKKTSFNNNLTNSNGVQNIIQALIVAEDRRFCKHMGIDFRGIVRSIYHFMLRRKLEGASTIEQQFVRTVRGRYEITLSRKLSECILAVIISSRHKKNIIAYSYLDIAYFGWRATGIKQAAKRLGVDLKYASKSEAAAIVAMLKVPMPRFPKQDYIARHFQRVQYILKNWEKVEKNNGFTF